MYALYQKISEGKGCRYIFQEEAHLLGCNVGFIPKMLAAVLRKDASWPMKWDLNVSDDLARIGLSNHALIISLKPYNPKNLSLYELMNVFGHCLDGWTPMMYHLRGLFIDEDPIKFDDKNFFRSASDIEDPIFTMAYTMSGTVKNGKIFGEWNPTRPGSSNSALLWPETFNYFVDMARKVAKPVQ